MYLQHRPEDIMNVYSYGNQNKNGINCYRVAFHRTALHQYYYLYMLLGRIAQVTDAGTNSTCD